jgi:hypothetical protein
LAERARIARSEALAACKHERVRRAWQEWRARRRAQKIVAFWQRNQRTPQIRKAAPLQIRRVRVVAGPRLRRVSVALPPGTSTYLTPEDRRLRHVRAQQRRSRRRMRLLEIRMQWARRQEEKIAASEDLWQFAQEDEVPRRTDRDLSAWPRLARREREQLAQEVESFAKISR